MSDQQWQQNVWQQPQEYPQGQPYPSSGYAPYYGYQPVASAPQKKGKGWIVALVIVVAIFILSALTIVSCTQAISPSFGSFGSLYSSSSDDAAFLTEDAIAIIEIDGTIQYDGTTSSPEGLNAQLEKASENPFIKAVVLRVNSGGGVATAGEEMSLYVKDFDKPVVVSSASINASAAYEISSQADYIYTAKTTAIGSIGTAMSVTDLSGLYEKLGIGIDDITSAESKNSSYGNRPLTEEEREYYQDMVDQINETFIETVAEGRSMSIEDVRKLATGLTFTGMTAVENGLADEIGTLEDACAQAADLAGISRYTTVNLRQNTALGMLDMLDLFGYESLADADKLETLLKEYDRDGSFSN